MDTIRTITEAESEAIFALPENKYRIRQHVPSDFTDTEYTVTVTIWENQIGGTALDTFQYKKARKLK